jgi:hypothetical protein
VSIIFASPLFLCPPGDDGDKRVASATLVSLTSKQRLTFCSLEDSLEQTPVPTALDFEGTFPSAKSKRLESSGLVFFCANLATDRTLLLFEKLQNCIGEALSLGSLFCDSSLGFQELDQLYCVG